MCIYRKFFALLNDDTLNALLITNKFYKKEKLLENEKDLANEKLSSKPAKPADFSKKRVRFVYFGLKFFWTATLTVSVVSAALAGFDDNFCFAKSFSFSSNFSFL